MTVRVDDEYLARLYHLRDVLRGANQARMRPYLNDPVAFAADCIDWPDGAFLTERQQEILTELATRGRVATRAPRGYGKTMPAAIAVHWYAATREGEDWKAPTTAGSWNQLKLYLWPEIHKWARRLRWSKLGRDPYNAYRELLSFSLTLTTGRAFAINSDEPDYLEGAHAAHILGIVDEGKAVPAASWDAIEGWFASPGETFTLAQSVPGPPAGRFYEIHSRKPGYEDWWPIHVTIDDALREGRLRPEWVEQRRRQWGEDSALFQNHVLAEFGGTEDGVIPLRWIEAAQDRWREWRDTLSADDYAQVPLTHIGVDVADTGTNETVLAMRSGPVVCALETYGSGDPLLTGDRTLRKVQARGGLPIVDGIGLGAGTVAHLRRDRHTQGTVSFIASEGTKLKDRSGEFGFNNKRSAAWWTLRELLDPQYEENVCLPPDDMLMGDLAAPTWREVAGGKIAVESKDDIAKRLGRSTDRGDAVVMAFWSEPSLQSSGWSTAMLGEAMRSANRL